MKKRPSSAERCADPADPMHGTVRGYKNHGCRCRYCKGASSVYGRERRNPEAVSETIDEIAEILQELDYR